MPIRAVALDAKAENGWGAPLTPSTAGRAFGSRTKSKNAFFLDSVTSAQSVIPQAAQAAGVPWGRRRVFLDNVDKPEAVEAQLREAAKLALKSGSCIAIGHPRKATLDVLERLAPELQAQGLALVKVSELVHP